MDKIVISQPYYFPWIGLFEQARLSDIFVHYDDVQFVKRHFMDRVQVPLNGESRWITIPKQKFSRETPINEILIDHSTDWRRSHLELLKQAYKGARYREEMIGVVDSVFSCNHKYLSDLTIDSIMAIVEYFSLEGSRKFIRSSSLKVTGSGTERLLGISEHFNAATYITAMGALKYFDFDLFEEHNINVEFIDYLKIPYSQVNEPFNPYVSVLDLVACHGKEGSSFICSDTVGWKEFVNSDQARKYLERKKEI